MIVISGSLVLSDSLDNNGTDVNAPLIGYHNLVTRENVNVDSAITGFPGTNLANPATILPWVSGSMDTQMVSMTVDYDGAVDYMAIARHNFGSTGASVVIQVTDGAGWITVVDDVIPPNDAPIIFRFLPRTVLGMRMVINPGNAPPRIAVLYAGKLLVVQRNIYVGHTPIHMGRDTSVVSGMSESGDFLGRIVLTESVGTGVDLKNLTPFWYRQYFDKFVVAAKEVPFFFAWRPADYPLEVGYAWLTNNPKPSNQLSNGMMQVSLQMKGVTL